MIYIYTPYVRHCCQVPEVFHCQKRSNYSAYIMVQFYRLLKGIETTVHLVKCDGGTGFDDK